MGHTMDQLSTGRQSSPSSSNNVYFKRTNHSAVAENVARTLLSIGTFAVANELMRNPPDLERLLDSVMPPPASSYIPSQSPAEVPPNVLATNNVRDNASK